MGLGLLASAAFPPDLFAQTGHAAKANKGPRALGLVELTPNGKAYLVPITILIDGKFYDASAYKAAPVPMALWSETVYEGFHTGVSQGLFTVRDALQKKDAKDADEWIGEGTWQSADSLKIKAAKKPAPSEPRGIQQDEGPPVLRRSPPKPQSTETPAAPPNQPAAASPTASPNTTPAASPPANAPSTSSSTSTPENATQDSAPPVDKDRPALKRGKQAPMPEEPPQKPASVKTVPPSATKTVPSAPTSANTLPSQAPAAQTFPAISDAGGPESRPYAYEMKPDYQQELRKKMLAMAGEEVRAYISAGNGLPTPAHAPAQRGKTTAKPVQPEFENVQFHVYDLANVNEPEMVLTASAHMPSRANEKSAPSDAHYMLTLVAREDVNGEVHKGLANITDAQHLDVVPRLDLIDAVDADGDGRAELLFRQVSDAGSAFVVYRVVGDRLYALFQGSLSR